ncbi:unnamed protein product [Macrosiphum euphorbiae]|uniref:Secreted protein n=1 Tax=Macrosiphum euphorbiae TaxID=13131 RepID=A0AAV0XJU5_9HEMI|nr:unnamed protein product [Macrosiphum euphorbiae]
MRRTIRLVRLQSVVRFLDLAAGSSTAAIARLASSSPRPLSAVSGSSSAWPELAAGTIGSSGTVSSRVVRSSDGGGTSGTSTTLSGTSTRSTDVDGSAGGSGISRYTWSAGCRSNRSTRPIDPVSEGSWLLSAGGCSAVTVSSASA